ncbi:unnamed protein product [Brassica rapa subsp. trilocularis]
MRLSSSVFLLSGDLDDEIPRKLKVPCRNDATDTAELVAFDTEVCKLTNVPAADVTHQQVGDAQDPNKEKAFGKGVWKWRLELFRTIGGTTRSVSL